MACSFLYENATESGGVCEAPAGVSGGSGNAGRQPAGC
ncbi:hypothetical protein C4K08_4681 [Pseudomonas chlororaphis subsp. aureofaciens]|nr:hypothetical protein C4K08_4681 [Pseudomonas chlororaphis subsp. aureofaciens]